MLVEDELYRISIEKLSEGQRTAEAALAILAEKPIAGMRQDALSFCLERSIELADGAILLAIANRLGSLAAVARSMYEAFLWAYFSSKSDGNAQQYLDTAQGQVLKVMKARVRAGLGRMLHRNTGEDVTDEFLSHKVPSPPRWSDMANHLGIGRVHNELYSLMSIYSHGSDVGFRNSGSDLVVTERAELVMVLAVAVFSLNGIVLAVRSIVIDGEPVPAEDVISLFGDVRHS
jgi:hypothetical protein